MSQQPYFYLHIPKTAGTSFREIVESGFDPQDICPAYLYKDLQASSGQGLTGYRLIRGHFRYEMLRHYLGFEPLLITMLREPVSRTLSNLRFFKRAKQLHGPLKKYVPVDDMTLEELSRNQIIRSYLRNFQVKKLAYSFRPAMSEPELLMFDKGIDYSGLLEKAQSRLRQAFFVGVTERFDESKKLLLRQYGRSAEDMVTPTHNVAEVGEKDHLSRDALDSLHELVEMDRLLYQTANELLDERLKG